MTILKTFLKFRFTPGILQENVKQKIANSLSVIIFVTDGMLKNNEFENLASYLVSELLKW